MTKTKELRIICTLATLTIFTSGCAGGRVVENPEDHPASYARILNNTSDNKFKASSALNDYPYANINLIWPLWSSDSSTNARYYRQHDDITVTEGWFHIVYTCPNVIFVDSYGKETLVHVKAGHTYKLVCSADSEYGSLQDQGL